MSDKTTVTKEPVSESGKSHVDEGQIQREKEIENRVRENLRAEEMRKSTGLSEKLSAYDEKIAELEEKVNLSVAEERKLDSLNSGKAQLEEQLRILETDPNYAAYRERTERVSAQTEARAVSKAKYEISLDLAESLISREARKENIDAKDLRKEINSILDGGRWGNLLPLHRAERALEERARLKQLEQDREELKKIKAERDGFSESGTKIARDRGIEELREAHISGDPDTSMKAGIERSKKLGL